MGLNFKFGGYYMFKIIVESIYAIGCPLEACLELYQTSIGKLFAKIVNQWKPFVYVIKKNVYSECGKMNQLKTYHFIYYHFLLLNVNTVRSSVHCNSEIMGTIICNVMMIVNTDFEFDRQSVRSWIFWKLVMNIFYQ